MEAMNSGLDLEEGLNDFDNVVRGIEDRQGSPLVEGQARMTDIEGDHVAHAQVIVGRDLQICMLVHHLGGLPM
jgi:hypothetical protein